jgi:hypothetical protein
VGALLGFSGHFKTQPRGANGHRTAEGGGGRAAGGPVELQGFAGSHTRPARPPEASSAGPPEAYIFLEGSCKR